MKLIPLDAVLAEIEKKKIPFKKDIDDGVYPTYLCALMDFEDFINSLEVKEADLENIAAVEWDDYIRKIDGEPDTAYMLIKRNEYIELAKHFFKLGFKIKYENRN